MPSQGSASVQGPERQVQNPASSDVGEWIDQMIRELKEMGALKDKAIEAAFRQTKRHLFVPNADASEAYRTTHAVPVKTTATETLSTMSAPQLQAEMLEQSAIEPGMNVLEIGSGGVNAAMIDLLVGEEGHVTSLDIDQDIVDHARACLKTAGHDSVQVQQGDAELGFISNAPYDRILVTCGSWDIPKAWKDQLKPGGKIIVPLRVRGITRSLELISVDEDLVSQSVKVCGFVKIQGEGAFNSHRVPFVNSEIAASYDEEEPQVLPEQFEYHQAAPDTVRYSDVSLKKGESFESLQLWLATRHPGFCRIASVSGSFAELMRHGIRVIDLGITRGEGAAAVCLVKKDGGGADLGAIGLTTNSESVTEECRQIINDWNEKVRTAADPVYTISHQQGNKDVISDDAFTVHKRHCTVSLAWPAATAN